KTKSITGYDPHPWQLDCAVATHLGRDVCVIAGTGFGKTLPFVMNCSLDPRLLVWIVSPLNALGNQQAWTFREWGIRAMAVNATTNYPGLRKAWKFQVVISSIEAFTDTTRLLPTVKSPELARRGNQQLVADEAHVIVKWGKSFRPLHGTMGDLKLVAHGDLPCIAATATANNLMRESIKQVLRFGPYALTINLGNHRPNLAYSVHRMARSSACISEVLAYFPSRTSFPKFALIFVDSRPVGQVVLHLLRQHVSPAIRWQVQIYHAFRSDLAKEVLAAGFEREDGFRVLVTTESLTLGIDFRKISIVIQVFAPTDIETLIQRMGRGGRDSSIISEAILMAQDSMFSDSQEGKKRLQKAMKVEEPTQYTEGVYSFINTTDCRVAVLDQECDNPP
ncbi:P-loop containing nucleoside triphosphate hydrolase protein, partial [Ceratobasidium sp. AG-I]